MLTRRHMATGIAALALLPGCGAGPRNAGARNVSQPLTVTTRADLSALSGDWFVRGHFQGAPPPELVTFLPEQNGAPAMALQTETCGLNGECTSEKTLLSLETLGPRRARDIETGREFWLVWIDEGLRTAAIGTPDGSFGWILDRRPTGGTDRIAAAREVLEFNGYDLSQLSLREVG